MRQPPCPQGPGTPALTPPRHARPNRRTSGHTPTPHSRWPCAAATTRVLLLLDHRLGSLTPHLSGRCVLCEPYLLSVTTVEPTLHRGHPGCPHVLPLSQSPVGTAVSIFRRTPTPVSVGVMWGLGGRVRARVSRAAGAAVRLFQGGLTSSCFCCLAEAARGLRGAHSTQPQHAIPTSPHRLSPKV